MPLELFNTLCNVTYAASNLIAHYLSEADIKTPSIFRLCYLQNVKYDLWLGGVRWMLLHPDHGLLREAAGSLELGSAFKGTRSWRQHTYVLLCQFPKDRKNFFRQIKIKLMRRFVRILGVNNCPRWSGFCCHLAASPNTTGAARTRVLWPKTTKSRVFTLALLKRAQQ